MGNLVTKVVFEGEVKQADGGDFYLLRNFYNFIRGHDSAMKVFSSPGEAGTVNWGFHLDRTTLEYYGRFYSQNIRTDEFTRGKTNILIRAIGYEDDVDRVLETLKKEKENFERIKSVQ